MNSALAIMAKLAASASAPAITSFGLYRKMLITRPRSESGSTAASRERRRRRGVSSSLVRFLGTFLHLEGLFWCGGARRRGQGGGVAGGFGGLAGSLGTGPYRR